MTRRRIHKTIVPTWMLLAMCGMFVLSCILCHRAEETLAAALEYEPEPVAVTMPVVVLQTVPKEPEPVPVQEQAEPEPAPQYFEVPLDTDLQDYIMELCEENGIDPAVVVAMIGRESSYKADSIGDGGNAYGLLQVWPRWHSERMIRLGVADLLNPYQNVRVAVDYLAELTEAYDGNIEMALVAYNAGCTGAYRDWFSRGVYSNDYSKAVLKSAEALRGETYVLPQ